MARGNRNTTPSGFRQDEGIGTSASGSGLTRCQSRGIRSLAGARRGALVALRVVLAFVLAFGTTLFVQAHAGGDAYASPADQAGLSAQDEGVDEGGGEDAGEGGEDGGGEPEPEPEPAPLHIIDIGVFESGTTGNAYAFASRVEDTREAVCAVIEQKGGSIDFDAGVEWSDESWEYESDKVTWSIAPGDEAIARITPSGILEAAGTEDGIVTVTASVSGEYTSDGGELAAVFLVELRGQTDTKYVTGIVVCDDAGNPIDPSYRFEEGTLATAMIELQARVTVFDPAMDSSIDYQVTPYEGLASQTGGELSDIRWESGDTRLGYVDETSGIYRPILEGTNIVYAYSTAGFNGQRITASATIDMPGEEHGDYHPQDSLTVEVYYEQYPDRKVAEKTYSISDLEALGTVTHTYTALRGDTGFFTTTGRGPLLIKVLEDAGVNTAGIARLRFGTPDNYQGVVSWDMLVDQDRYYFPNIDANSYAGKVQVPPIIAIESHRNVGTDTAPNYDMDDQRRFLLLFGSKATGETTTSLQVYNIHTLYVELEGAPPVEPDIEIWTVKYVDSLTGGTIDTRQATDPDKAGAPAVPVHEGYEFEGWSKSTDEAAKTVTFTAVYKKAGDSGGDDPDDPGNPDDPGKPDNPDDPSKPSGDDPAPPNNGGADPGSGNYDLVSSRGDASSSAPAGNTGGAESLQQLDVTPIDPNELKVVTSGKWSAIQAINKHPSNVDELMLENPFAPFVGPTFAGVLVAGGLESGLAFARQRRKPR